MTDSAEDIRGRLLRAASDLLEGRVAGPLTSLRLVEVAGVKRHRLTHDNPDINSDFQRRARDLNRTKPEVDNLREQLRREQEKSSSLRQKLAESTKLNTDYASTIIGLLEERDLLQRLLDSEGSNVRKMFN